jgi:ribokinase
MGSKGAYVYTDELNQIVPAFEVEAVDTTAAGDCFNGALAVGLGRGMDMIESVRYANRAASITVTRAGAQISIPNRNEVESGL